MPLGPRPFGRIAPPEPAWDKNKHRRDGVAAVLALVAEHAAGIGGNVACLLIDEAQFLHPRQVDDLLRIVVDDGIPVLLPEEGLEAASIEGLAA